MKLAVVKETLESDFVKEVERRSGVHLAECYLCGKCTAGCPLAYEMDIPPHRIMRLLQLGQEEEILNCQAIWLCVSAWLCTARCPKDIDVGSVMDTLRHIAVERGIVNEEATDILTFHKTFLKSIRSHGRLYEVGLVGRYKMETGHLFQDLMLAPVMFFKGKLRLKPHRIKGRKEIKRIFAKCGVRL